jgi:hypothetical protein
MELRVNFMKFLYGLYELDKKNYSTKHYVELQGGEFRNKLQYAFFSAGGGRRGFLSGNEYIEKAIWDDFHF